MPSKMVTHNDKSYVVFGVKFDKYYLPVVVDSNDFKLLSKMGKVWKCNNNGSIYCSHSFNGITKDIFLHEVIMNIKQKDANDSVIKAPMIHINRIKLDNRRNNIIYDTHDKDINKNQKKKKRTVELPNDSGIDPDELPTYVWYMKPDDTHGERFMVSIGDINWKTTSSKYVSLKNKLEEAKMYLRKLKEDNPNIFDEFSMNGDLNKEGKKLSDDYYDIIHNAGYNYIKKIINNNTVELIKPMD
jgi:hypothetical protein